MNMWKNAMIINSNIKIYVGKMIVLIIIINYLQIDELVQKKNLGIISY